MRAGWWRASPRELVEQTTAEPRRLLSVHGRDGALDAGGGLRVAVSVERLRVGCVCQSPLRNRDSTLCRDRVDPGGNSWGGLPDTRTVSYACIVKIKNVPGQAGERGEVECPIANHYNHICICFPTGSRRVLGLTLRYLTAAATIHYQIGTPPFQRRFVPHDFTLASCGPKT